jgi:hypothetical protein
MTTDRVNTVYEYEYEEEVWVLERIIRVSRRCTLGVHHPSKIDSRSGF